MSSLQVSISPAKLVHRTRAVIICSTLIVTAAAWLWLKGMAASDAVHSSLLLPHHCHLDLRSLSYVLLMWLAMSVAMMSPIVLRWLVTFATLGNAADPARSLSAQVSAFAAGYFLVWLAYSAVATVIQAGLQQVGFIAHGRVQTSVGALVLVAAGLFQFTPLKGACLRHCRNPVTYFLSRWRSRPAGGFVLGATHGAYCLGCCLLLMMTAFAMGVMNVAWMAALTLMLAVEQLAPHGERIARGLGVAMCIWGIGLLL